MIPVNEPLLDGNEEAYLTQCIRDGWISSEGPFVGEFEKKLSQRVGRQYGIAVCNGSVALELAVAALNLAPGDEVIMPAFTIISCAAAIIRQGATPVLIDADPLTWNMDTRVLEERVTSKTKAIMVVHIYGLPTDMAHILEIAGKYGLRIIEDAAEAHGQTCHGKPCGSFGDLSTFSFYPNKNITTGEGGMILTDSPELAERCRSLRNLCFNPKKRFVHDELGWNFRMSNLQAALGVAQLERLDEFIEIKQKMGARYSSLLNDIPGIQLPLAATDFATNTYWVYGLVLNENGSQDAEMAMNRLSQLGIGTRPFFWPMHEQPVFKKMGLFLGERYPVSEHIARHGFYIPSGLALSDAQIEEAAAAVIKVLQ